jgi:uncharacterized membrane protein YdbT with pleckstrin-like domain
MREINKVINEDEVVLWEGTPSFWPFILGGSIVVTIFGLFWMLCLIPFIGVAIYDVFYGSHIFGYGIFLLPHFWIGIGMVFGIPLYQLLVFKHTYYSITDKRVILQSGWIGRDFKIIDFDQIANAEVKIGVLDKLFGGNTGSIYVSTAGSSTNNNNGFLKPNTIRNVPNPYEVFKALKKISLDVKTDIEYPNKLRPGKNTGYQTKYDSKGK